MIRKTLLWIRFLLSRALPRKGKFYYRQPHPLAENIARGEKRGFRTLSDSFYRNTRSEVLMLNPFYGHQGTDLDNNFYRRTWKYRIAKGLPTYCTERGPLPYSWIIDPTGFHAESRLFERTLWDFPLQAAEINQAEKCLQWLKTSDASWEKQGNNADEILELERCKTRFSKLNTVFMQMRKDSVVLMFHGWCGSQEGMLKAILEQARALPDQLFLIKAHPLDPDWITSAEFPENVRSVNQVSYKILMQLCDTVITMNSGLGCQAMFWGKPLIQLGKSYYRHEGLNHSANNSEELEVLLRHCAAPEKETVLRFLVHLLRVSSWENPETGNPFLHIAWNQPENIREQSVIFPF